MSGSSNFTGEIAKASPGVAVSGAIWLGMPISDWVAIITLLYLLLQIGLTVPKYVDQVRKWRRGS